MNLLLPLAVTLATLATGELHEPGTIVAAVEIQRDAARLVAFTRKERPFPARLADDARSLAAAGGAPGFTASLLCGDVPYLTRRIAVADLCLDHDADVAPHRIGDRIRPHRETILVELPDIPGCERLEIRRVPSASAADVTAVLRLDPAHFRVAGDRAGAPESASAEPRTFTPSTIEWPEDHSDPDIYLTYGDEAAAAERINVVVIPDAYKYANKALMRQHFDALVGFLATKSPFREHGNFINYTLVYAYSRDEVVDECDCGVAKNTAMNTGFPDIGLSCGSFEDRCLFYGLGDATDCDPGPGADHVAQAELRAPAWDTTILMVNTARYGGCASGARQAFSAAYLPAIHANDLAAHGLGHTLGGLDEEFGGDPTCGVATPARNVSGDPVDGAWPEWTAELGPPAEGAQTHDHCIFRPFIDCAMRTIGQPFCPVCTQYLALAVFDHPRVRDTAPIRASVPGSPLAVAAGTSVDFSVVPRLAIAPTVGNRFVWRIQGPGYPTPTPLGGDGPALSRLFTREGTTTLTCELVADTQMIKPERNGANVDLATWTIDVTGNVCDPAPSFAGIASVTDRDPACVTGIELAWDGAAFGAWGGSYTIWRDDIPIATDVTGVSYLDLPGDSLVHDYGVTAVTADCATADGNSARATGTDGGGPPPPALGNVLRMVRSGGGVALRWADEPLATTYDVSRSTLRDHGSPREVVGVATTGVTGVDDLTATADFYSYRVRWFGCGWSSY